MRKRKRRSERKRENWTGRRDDEWTRSEGVIKQKEGVQSELGGDEAGGGAGGGGEGEAVQGREHRAAAGGMFR